MAYTAAFPQSGSSSAGIRVISASDIGQASNTEEFPLLFLRSAVGSKVPCVGLVEVARLGQWLNVPTQGWRVPFSLTVLGIEPGLHWWEADAMNQPTEH